MLPKRLICWAGALLTLAACGDGVDQEDIDACVRRGVEYFKEIGSYPTLQSSPNTGRAAEDVAIERCNRTTTAF
jgi:hypothetical protein